MRFHSFLLYLIAIGLSFNGYMVVYRWSSYFLCYNRWNLRPDHVRICFLLKRIKNQKFAWPLTEKIPKKFDQSKRIWPLVQTQSRQKLSKRGLNMLLKSTVYDWCTIGDRVTGQSRQLLPTPPQAREGLPDLRSAVSLWGPQKMLWVDLAEKRNY